MLSERHHALIAERRDFHKARGRLVTVQDTVLDVDGGDASRLQYAEKLRDKEIHLLPEIPVGRVVPKVFILSTVFVMISEWDARVNKSNVITGDVFHLEHAVVIDGGKK